MASKLVEGNGSNSTVKVPNFPYHFIVNRDLSVAPRKDARVKLRMCQWKSENMAMLWIKLPIFSILFHVNTMIIKGVGSLQRRDFKTAEFGHNI